MKAKIRDVYMMSLKLNYAIHVVSEDRIIFPCLYCISDDLHVTTVVEFNLQTRLLDYVIRII